MSRRGWLLFAVMCVVWGVPYLMIKVALEDLAPPVIVLARTALGAAVLMPFAVRSGGLGVLRRRWRPLLAFAAVEIVGPWWLIADAERRISSSLTGLLVAAVPIIGVLLARATGGTERIGRTRGVGLAAGLAGVALLAAPHLGGGSALSVAEVLLVAVGYAVGPLIAARRLADVPNLPMTAACLAVAALVYTPAAVATLPDGVPGARVLAALAVLAVVCTALAFAVFFELIREVGPARAVVFTYVNPAVAVAAGVVLLGEPLTPGIVGAFGLILAGSVLATGRRRQRRPAPEPPAVSGPQTVSGQRTADHPTR